MNAALPLNFNLSENHLIYGQQKTEDDLMKERKAEYDEIEVLLAKVRAVFHLGKGKEKEGMKSAIEAAYGKVS
jgi:hypothetical protein